jgi:hypothetical protein
MNRRLLINNSQVLYRNISAKLLMIKMTNATGKKAAPTNVTKGVRILIAMALVAGLLGGLMGGLLFATSGPQGIQGEQGPQGEPGLDGTDTVQQIVQSQNVSSASLGAYVVNQWYGMSVFDGSMSQVITVSDQSSIGAEFSGSVYLSN